MNSQIRLILKILWTTVIILVFLDHQRSSIHRRFSKTDDNARCQDKAFKKENSNRTLSKVDGRREDITPKYRNLGGSHRALSRSCYIYDNVFAENTCCRMHDYLCNVTDVLTCLKRDFAAATFNRSKSFRAEGGQWIIRGDSRLRFFFFGIIRRLAGSKLVYRFPEDKMEWQNIDRFLRQERPYIFRKNMEVKHLDVPQMRLTFHWDPKLKTIFKKIPWWVKYDKKRPTQLLISTGTHYMAESQTVFEQRGLRTASKRFRRHLKRLIPKLSSLTMSLPVTFHFLDHFQERLILPRLKEVWQKKNVEHYNSLLESHLFTDSSFSISAWDSNVPLSEAYDKECTRNPKQTADLAWRCNDPVHMGYVIIDQYWNMFLNYACNKYMDFGSEYC